MNPKQYRLQRDHLFQLLHRLVTDSNFIGPGSRLQEVRDDALYQKLAKAAAGKLQAAIDSNPTEAHSFHGNEKTSSVA